MAPTAYRFDTDRMRVDMAVRGMTLRRLAKAAGVAPPSVSYFLSGRTRSVKMAQKLAGALGFAVRRYVITKDREGAA